MNITLSTDDKRINLTQTEQSVRLLQENNNVNLSQNTTEINLTQSNGNGIDLSSEENRITFTQPNLRGLPGPAGPANNLSIGTVEDGEDAAATITGESPDQFLNLVLPRGEPGPAGSGDKNYTATFSPTDNLLVTHNLDKYPAVDVINSAGDEVVGSVNYLTTNTLIVSFSAPFGGRITCN